MKKLIKFIKKYLEGTMLVIGTGLFVYNVFDISYKDIDRSHSGYEIIYYYHSDTIINISIGAMLIIAGILIIKRSK